ncbi:MAG TPA: MerR family transcriptional regulator [Coriobacteriia bacterium]
MAWTVGEVAGLAKVSVRTLHHYDEIGLLGPSARTHAGYRLYEHADLERLQQVMFFRELGFPLDEIKRLMGDPAFDRRDALRAQREMLARKARRTTEMLAAIDAALDGDERGTHMDESEMFEVFGEFDPKEYEEEVQRRWGEGDAYKESAKRAARYTKEDWKRFKAESEANGVALVAAMDRGLEPGDPEVMDLVEEARLLIDRWFYPCSHEMHVGLAEMYVADPRFTATYEKMHEGMARFVHDAIKANAARNA